MLDGDDRVVGVFHSAAGNMAEGPGKVMWATRRSNVREGPGTSYAKVDLLEVGESVHVIDRTGDWLRLKPRPGQPDRFVYGPLLTESVRSTSTQ